MLITLILTFYFIPTVIYAEIADAVSDTGTKTDSGENIIEEQKDAVYEDISLREMDVKHFRLSDGSYVAAQYPYPVHYSANDGALEDIDNSLSEVSGGVYANPTARIKFAKKITGSSTLFTLMDGSTKLTMSLIGAKKGVKGEITNYEDNEGDTELQKMMNLEKISSRIIYEEILDGVDLEYIVHSLNVKENIIVNKKQSSYSYSFEIKLNGLTAQLAENGDINILNESDGEIKYVIPAPIIYDASGAYAPEGAGTFSLEGGKNGKYELTVSVSSEWMNSEDRVFPVTVDPTLGQIISNRYMQDTYIDADNPGTSFYSSNPLRVSTNDTVYWRVFTLPTVPANAYISEATVSYYATHVSAPMALGAHLVTVEWGSALTYNSYIGGAAAYESAYQDIAEPLFDEYVEFDITDAVKRWYGGTANYGIAIKPISGAGYASTDYVTFNPIENNNYRPMLSVCYRVISGIEDYWSYSTQSAGIAGTGYVNLATGLLTFTIPLLSTTDFLMPYTPTLVYNQSMAGLDYNSSNATVPYASARAPLGMMLNTSETIKSVSLIQPDGLSVMRPLYIDSDGTEHHFILGGDDNDSFLYDEDGLGLILRRNSDGGYAMTDKNKTVRTFTQIPYQYEWYLTRIQDKNGNAIVFDTDSQYRATAISLDPAGSVGPIQMLTLHYNSDGRLVRVYNPTSKEAAVLRYSATYDGAIVATGGKYLKQIDYARGTDSVTDANWTAFEASASANTNITVNASAYYEYRSSEGLYTAKDGTTNITIGYFSPSPSASYVCIYEKDESGNRGQQIFCRRYNGYTEIQSPGNDDISQTDDDVLTRYVLDENGRTISSYSYIKEKYEIYGAVNGKYSNEEITKNNLTHKTVLGGTSVNYILNGGFERSTSQTSFSNWSISSSGVTRLDTGMLGTSSGGYAVSLSPPSGTTASISQDLFLYPIDYNLSFPYLTQNGAYGSALVKITSPDGLTVFHSESMNINPSASNGIYSFFSTDFSIYSFGDYKIVIEVTADDDAPFIPLIKVDDIMLEIGAGASDYTFVENGGFWPFYESGTFDSLWYRSNSEITKFTSNEKQFTHSIHMPSSMDNSYIRQRIFTASAEDISGGVQNNYGTDYVLSGYAKAENAVLSGNSPFRLRMEIAYYQGENQPDIIVNKYVDFLPNVKDWQFASGTVETLPEDNSMYYTIRYINVYCEYYMQPNGDSYFDNISVTRATTNTREYKYNDKGYLTEDNGYYNSTYYVYDDNNNIIRVADTRGRVVDYTYTTNGLPLDEIVSDISIMSHYSYDEFATGAVPLSFKQCTTYQYNEYGLVMSKDTVDLNSDGTLSASTADFRTEYTYVTSADSKIFGALTKERDLAGATTCYYYDATNGNLMAKVNISSTYGTAYTYDALGRLISAVPARSSSDASYTVVNGAESVEYTYVEGKLYNIKTYTTEYLINRDNFGRIVFIKSPTGTFATYRYNDSNGKLNKITFGNKDVEEYVYNDLELLSEIWYTESGGTKTLHHKYEYTASGMLYKYTDYVNGRATVCKYDASDRLVNMSEYDINTNMHEYSATLGYTEEGRLSGKYLDLEYSFTNGASTVESISASLNYTYSYGDNGAISRQTYYAGGGISLIMNYSYDKYDRVSSVVSTHTTGELSFIQQEQYVYDTKVVDGGYYDSARVKRYVSTVNGVQTAYTYTYNSSGYITSITMTGASGTRTVGYIYNNLGQLTSEEDVQAGIRYLYTYDKGGNLAIKRKSVRDDESIWNPTETYSYAPQYDRITTLNGSNIKYDIMGNPIVYYDGVTNYQFTWSGKQLSSATISGNTYTFTYNADGLRRTKTVNGNTTTYYYDGDRLISEQDNTGTTVYIYDANGSPVGMQYRLHSYAEGVWDVYRFEKNIQGDVVAIYNSQGTKLISYVYTAYGICGTSTHNGGGATTATKNRLTYRGYYFDMDLQMYYLNSRYYNQNTCRFISPDSVMSGVNGSLHGFNLYAYCFNNPVNMTDASGNWPEWIEKFGAWLKETVGSAVILEQEYEVFAADNLFFGIDVDAGSSKVLAGDADKTVVTYSTVAPKNGSFVDAKAGIQANVNNGGVAIESNVINTSLIMANGDSSTEFIFGLNKIGFTFRYGADFGNRTADSYVHVYIRTIPCALLAGAIYYSHGSIIPAQVPVL